MSTSNPTTRFAVFRSPETFELFAALEKKKRFDPLREIKYRASELPVSRRVLSHWRDAGLLDVYGDNPDQIKVSFIGLFWLMVAIELRRFGISIDKISSIKNHFFRDPKFPVLEGCLFSTFANKNIDIFIIVSSDGRADIGTKNEIELAEAFGFIQENYIKLNVRMLKNRIMSKKDEKIVSEDYTKGLLTDDEKTILDLIRDGDYKEVILKFEDGTVSRIAKKTLISNSNPIQELKKIISSADGFCDISIKKVNGKIVLFENTTMLKT